MLRDIPSPFGVAGGEIFMNNPGTEHEASLAPNTATVDSFDDVFGSAPPSPLHDEQNESGTPARAQLLDPSDIPRLRSTHVTNGYREGIAASKEQHIQEGFDEGYSLGAELGMKAGWCLGALDGLARAVPDVAGESQSHQKEGDTAVTKDKMVKMLCKAENELKVQSLFDKEYFGSDGIWLYDVAGQENDDEVTFFAVAEAHPVIRKWVDALHELARASGLELR